MNVVIGLRSSPHLHLPHSLAPGDPQGSYRSPTCAIVAWRHWSTALLANGREHYHLVLEATLFLSQSLMQVPQQTELSSSGRQPPNLCRSTVLSQPKQSTSPFRPALVDERTEASWVRPSRCVYPQRLAVAMLSCQLISSNGNLRVCLA
jgi:hypothetical protein